MSGEREPTEGITTPGPPGGERRFPFRKVRTGPGRSVEGEAGRSLAVHGVSWLAADLLLVVSSFDPRSGDEPRVEVEADGGPVEARAECICRASEEVAGAVDAILVVGIPDAAPGRTLRITLRSGKQEVASLGPADAAEIGVDLRTLIREGLAPLSPSARGPILDFVVRAAARNGHTVDRLGLSTSLAMLRDALREPSPHCEPIRGAPQRLHIGRLVRIDELSYFVRGWMHDQQAEIVRLTAISPEGSRASLLETLFRVRRPDLASLFDSGTAKREKLGFLARFTLDVPVHVAEGWIFEIENAAGVSAEVEAPSAIDDPVEGRNTILAELPGQRWPDSPLMEHVVPAVTRLQERLAETVEIEEIVQFGDPPGSPEVSIVVPLYRRTDLLEQQLAQFADDPEISATDLIYVLDSPGPADALMREAAELFELYRVPFRLADLSSNGGYSLACNRGALFADAPLLVLLHSDVLPTEGGWLGRLAEFHRSKPEIGSVGPKLLLDDGSIQHAGLHFRRPAGPAPWELAHYLEGLHRHLPAADVSRPVPAVSGACMMVDRDLFRELGGLSTAFVRGGYEDSDLCMRLREAGREIWYAPEVELYHLQGRSYSSRSGHREGRYNAWLHSRLWGEQIERLMSEQRFKRLPDSTG